MSAPAVTFRDIKAGVDLRELVSGYLKLRRSGRNEVALCPFHAEESPSFTLHGPEFERWKCYGCGAGGDAGDFLQGIEGLTVTETRRRLAALAGIDISGPSLSLVERRALAERIDQDRAIADESDLFWIRLYVQISRRWGRLQREVRAIERECLALPETDGMDSQFAAFAEAYRLEQRLTEQAALVRDSSTRDRRDAYRQVAALDPALRGRMRAQRDEDLRFAGLWAVLVTSPMVAQ